MADEDTKTGKSGDDKESSLEKVARRMGWAPEEEWTGHPDDYVNAETFILNEREMHKTTKQALEREKVRNAESNKELSEIKKGLSEVRAIHAREMQRALKKQREELLGKRREAIQGADADAVESLDTQIKEVDGAISETEITIQQATKEPEKKKRTDDEPFPEFDAWKARNQWYGTNAFLSNMADAIAKTKVQEVMAANPGKTPEELQRIYPPEKVFEHAAAEIERRFPEEYKAAGGIMKNDDGKDKRRQTSDVDTGGLGRRRESNRSSHKWTEKDMTKEQIQGMENMLAVVNVDPKNPVITRDQYIHDLGERGELG